jgi:hypothetical protein
VTWRVILTDAVQPDLDRLEDDERGTLAEGSSRLGGDRAAARRPAFGWRTGALRRPRHDAASEISSFTPSGGSATDYEYNTDGQLCWTATTTGSCTSPPSGAVTYSYNTAGERLSSSVAGYSTPTTYQWNQAGDLVCENPANASGFTCSNPSAGQTATFTYNGDGLRMSDYLPASETTQQFTWDVSGSVPRLLECIGEYFLYGPNVGSAPIEQISVSGGTRQFLVSDPTGVREGTTAQEGCWVR